MVLVTSFITLIFVHAVLDSLVMTAIKISMNVIAILAQIMGSVQTLMVLLYALALLGLLADTVKQTYAIQTLVGIMVDVMVFITIIPVHAQLGTLDVTVSLTLTNVKAIRV